MAFKDHHGGECKRDLEEERAAIKALLEPDVKKLASGPIMNCEKRYLPKGRKGYSNKDRERDAAIASKQVDLEDWIKEHSCAT